MSLWSAFKSWLYSKPKREATAKHPDVYDLDVKKLAQELRLEEEARRLAAAGLPAPDAAALSAPEEAVVQRVELARQDFIDWASLRTAVLNESLARQDITPIVNRVLEAARNFEQRASTIISESAVTVQGLTDRAASAQAELERFRQEHRLDRPALEVTGARTFLTYAVLALLVVFEGSCNAFFFAQGLDSGLLGGFIYAAMLAALNVGIAFALGKFGVRRMYHRSPAIKALGSVWLLVAIATMLGFALVIAHSRDALVTGETDAFRAALRSLTASPLELRDLTSWILFVASLVFALISLGDGLRTDDSYPGYGPISRAAEDAVGALDDEVSALRKQLEDLKEEALESIDSDVKAAQVMVSRYESLLDDKRSAALRLDTALDNAENCMKALLREFRDKNELHRDGKPRPPHFDVYPPVRPLQKPDFAISDGVLYLAHQRTQFQNLLGQVEKLKGAILASFNHEFDALKPLVEQFMASEKTGG